ncbi:hypothetical protein BHE74_00018005 [Ensete ventricosum]|nr:hypothetical protein GW17_00027990 [Ensete ventricosum]RWW74070.1 hypothetical protein BHE74_00018005 [Ensete ventricosum]RZS02324.1 hypothetical protein BHM03_00032360 [Ensete ventricosum]
MPAVVGFQEKHGEVHEEPTHPMRSPSHPHPFDGEDGPKDPHAHERTSRSLARTHARTHPSPILYKDDSFMLTLSHHSAPNLYISSAACLLPGGEGEGLRSRGREGGSEAEGGSKKTNMELFPAQPDLSLQISPPNSKPTPSWSRTSDENLDLGFCWRAIDSSDKSDTAPSLTKADNAGFEFSLANQSASETHGTNRGHHQLHFHQHHPVLHQGYRQDLGLLMPIRGIPVYHNPPAAFRFLENQQQQQQQQPHSCDSAAQGLSRSTSRFLPRFPAKRSMRAPRMRWTTTLHARFVHAVELLGGHESA